MRRVRAKYHGQVQGVGFRATCQSIAAGYVLTGFVRNEPDGTVLLEAQGDSVEVTQFLDGVQSRLDQHISLAAVTEIPTISETAPFRIQY